MMFVARWLLISIALGGCGSPCLQVKDTRCNGQVVEVCGSNKKWQRVIECFQIKSIKPGAPTKWTCGSTATGCTCVPGGK